MTFSYLWTGNEAKALEGIIAEFNKSQDKITVVGVSSPDFQKQLASMSAAKGTFDISDNFGNGVGSWASKGILTPLDSYIQADHVDTGDFVPAAMNQMKYKGHTYSLPIAVHDFELLYNKTEFAAAGISAPPTTMEDLATDIAKLTKVDASGNITQLGLGNPDTGTTMTTLGYAFGGTWDGPDGATPSPDNPANIAAVEFYRQNIIDKYGAAKVAKFTAGWGQYMSAQDPFYTGKVAMIIDGEWQPVSIPTTNPSLQWAVANIPYPAAKPNLAGTTQLTASTLFIPTNAAHKAEAFEFMKYLTGAAGMAAFTKALGNLPARTSLLDSNTYASIPQFSMWLQNLKNPNVHALASQPYSQQYSSDLATAFKSVLDGSKTPQDAMASVAAGAKQYPSS
ncbi:MAG: ABC transporter substrate-binding protein [Micromonosporaceae bacterium]|nr:ABC transporter substrate-binding protein [Micromonosporaceae bacterium]